MILHIIYYLDINLSINDRFNSTVNPNDIILPAGLVHRISMGRRVPLSDWQFDYQFHCVLHPGPYPELKNAVQTGCQQRKNPRE